MNNLKVLNVNELEQVSGGRTATWCLGIGFSTDVSANACAGIGTGARDEEEGFGANACAFIGVGVGANYRSSFKEGDDPNWDEA